MSYISETTLTFQWNWEVELENKIIVENKQLLYFDLIMNPE